MLSSITFSYMLGICLSFCCFWEIPIWALSLFKELHCWFLPIIIQALPYCHMLLILLTSLADTQSVMFSLNPYAVSNALCPSLWTSFSVWYHPSFSCEGRLLQPSFCELAVHVTHILIFYMFILFTSTIF